VTYLQRLCISPIVALRRTYLQWDAVGALNPKPMRLSSSCCEVARAGFEGPEKPLLLRTLQAATEGANIVIHRGEGETR